MSWIGWVVIVFIGIVALDLCLIGYLSIRYKIERRREERRRWQ